MNDMSKKLSYFVNSGGKPKFKRAVPADIRHVVGQKNWVKSVGSLSSAQLKLEAVRFAAFTNEEIERCRGQLAGSVTPRLEVKEFHNAVDAIVARYQSEREDARLRQGTYFMPVD